MTSTTLHAKAPQLLRYLRLRNSRPFALGLIAARKVDDVVSKVFLTPGYWTKTTTSELQEMLKDLEVRSDGWD